MLLLWFQKLKNMSQKNPNLLIVFAVLVLLLPVISTLFLGTRSIEKLNSDFYDLSENTEWINKDKLFIFKNNNGFAVKLSHKTPTFLPILNKTYFNKTNVRNSKIRDTKAGETLVSAYNLLDKERHSFIVFENDTMLNTNGSYVAVTAKQLSHFVYNGKLLMAGNNLNELAKNTNVLKRQLSKFKPKTNNNGNLKKVNWKNNKTVKIDDQEIKATGSGWDSSAAFAGNSLTADKNGFFAFQIKDIKASKALGLSSSPSNLLYDKMDFALVITNGTLLVFEKGVRQTKVGNIKKGDKLSLHKIGKKIFYCRNAEVVYASNYIDNKALTINANFYSKGASFDSVRSSF